MPDWKEKITDAIFEKFTLEDIITLIGLRIIGVEVTQGIQYYKSHRHLTDSADRGADNSVRLVAEKPAWVRVYLRSGTGSVDGVTGTLKVLRRSGGAVFNEIDTLAPAPPGSVTATFDPDYATERETFESTLNFYVPADLMWGTLRFEVAVNEPGGQSDTSSTFVEATLRQTLSMRMVPISYDGTDASGNPLTLAAPTLADAQTEAGWSLLVYPVRSTPDISLGPSVELTVPLTGSPVTPGGCAQSWLDLNVLVARAKATDGDKPGTFYYGLVPAGVPLGANSGCATSGVTSGMQNRPVTMAHEFGHALGYPHAPCGNVGSGDPTYPAYEPYDPPNTPTASIGEYGIDIGTGDIKPPLDFRDYMSYCSPRWISLHNYQKAIDHELLSPEYVGDKPWWWWDEMLYDRWWWLKDKLPDPPPWIDEIMLDVQQPREPVVSVIGVVHRSGAVDVRSLTRAVVTRSTDRAAGSSLVAELLDEGGAVISSAPVRLLVSYGNCGCRGSDVRPDSDSVFQAYIPDKGRGAALRIVDGEEVRWRRDAPTRQPQRPTLKARPGRDGSVSISWSGGGEDEEGEVWVRARRTSRDEPETVHIGRGRGKAVIPAGRLAPGAVLLDAYLQNGWDAVASESVEVRVGAAAPAVSILHPRNHATLLRGRPLRLHGMATTAAGSPVEPERLVWTIDGQEDVATGADAMVVTPEPGDHEVTLRTRGRPGGTASVVVHVIDPSRGPERPKPTVASPQPSRPRRQPKKGS